MTGLALCCVLMLACANAVMVPPEEYDRWSAVDKFDWFTAHIDAGHGGTPAPAFYWTEGPDSCVHPECIYPGGHATRKDIVGHYECRSMGLHPTGVVAFVKAVWEPNPYTGMFQKADYGFARWGYQADSIKHDKQRQSGRAYYLNQTLLPLEGNMTWETSDCSVYDCFNVSKGFRYDRTAIDADAMPDKGQFMALKFFRGQVPSAAIHTGPAEDASHNHLGVPYTNLMMNYGESANDTTSGSMSDQATQRGTAWPGFTGLHDMGMFNQEGELQHNLKFPWQIIFFPKTNGTIIPDSPFGYYQDMVQLAEAGGLGPGSAIFDIYVKDTFEAPMTKIGELQLTSKIMMSADTDRQVFFFHPRYDRDMILRPELLKGYHCDEWWHCAVCPAASSLCSPDESTLEIWKILYEEAKTALKSATATLRRLPGLEPKRPNVPFSCGYAQATQARHQKQEDDGGALLQKTVAIQRGHSFLHRRGQQHQQHELEDAPEMRSDDLAIEPLSKMLHNLTTWFCDGKAERFPRRPRAKPYSSSCTAVRVPGRSEQEPEWALPEDCQDLPLCSKFDGTWYSSIYPCRCGNNVCKTGQLCTRHSSSCISWGPFAQH